MSFEVGQLNEVGHQVKKQSGSWIVFPTETIYTKDGRFFWSFDTRNKVKPFLVFVPNTKSFTVSSSPQTVNLGVSYSLPRRWLNLFSCLGPLDRVDVVRGTDHRNTRVTTVQNTTLLSGRDQLDDNVTVTQRRTRQETLATSRVSTKGLRPQIMFLK